MRATAFIAGLALLAAACGGSVDDAGDVPAGGGTTQSTVEGSSAGGPTVPATTTVPSSTASSSTVSTSSTTTTAPASPTTTPPPSSDPVAVAVADLAGRLQIDPAAVAVVSVEEVTWPDASIGCPQPEMSYAQVLVNGTRMVLEAGGIEYHYHSGGGGDPFSCADPQDPIPGGGGDA